jgi:hypothetical protein
MNGWMKVLDGRKCCYEKDEGCFVYLFWAWQGAAFCLGLQLVLWNIEVEIDGLMD